MAEAAILPRPGSLSATQLSGPIVILLVLEMCIRDSPGTLGTAIPAVPGAITAEPAAPDTAPPSSQAAPVQPTTTPTTVPTTSAAAADVYKRQQHDHRHPVRHRRAG